jgi:hypothetical protein
VGRRRLGPVAALTRNRLLHKPHMGGAEAGVGWSERGSDRSIGPTPGGRLPRLAGGTPARTSLPQSFSFRNANGPLLLDLQAVPGPRVDPESASVAPHHIRLASILPAQGRVQTTRSRDSFGLTQARQRVDRRARIAHARNALARVVQAGRQQARRRG